MSHVGADKYHESCRDLEPWPQKFFHGHAIVGGPKFDQDSGAWFVTNEGEYGTQVWFCPFCGVRLPT